MKSIFLAFLRLELSSTRTRTKSTTFSGWFSVFFVVLLPSNCVLYISGI